MMKVLKKLYLLAIILPLICVISCESTKNLLHDVGFDVVTKDQKMWALATNAIIHEKNAYEHHLLGGMVPTEKNKEFMRKQLKKWWRTSSREDLLKMLQWIEDGGHREEFNELKSRVSKMSKKEYLALAGKHIKSGEQDIADKIAVARTASEKLDENGILAWDYGRYVGLCGWGYIAGYLEEDEAWDRIMPVARMLQGKFNSWPELGMSFVVGRMYWNPKDTRSKERPALNAFKRLRVSPASPWNVYPWDMDLE